MYRQGIVVGSGQLLPKYKITLEITVSRRPTGEVARLKRNCRMTRAARKRRSIVLSCGGSSCRLMVSKSCVKPSRNSCRLPPWRSSLDSARRRVGVGSSCCLLLAVMSML